MGGGDADVAANSGGDNSKNNDDSLPAVPGSDSDGAVNINIRCSNGSKFSVQVCLTSSVASFKSDISQRCDIPAEQQRLIYKGRILKDDQTLASYGLMADHTIHLVRGFAPPPPTTNGGSTNPGLPNANQTGQNAGGGALGESGLGASLFPGLGGGLFGSGLPDFDQVQQQLNQNPNMMRDILNTPLVQNVMNNPEIIRNMIMNNPQMREIMDRNPELAHILNDPATLRQTMEAARNPELMREMMRNTDRAMSNIESSPEGFNMLRRMYETVQEPFLNATTMTGTDSGSNPNPFAALLGQSQSQSQTTTTTPPVPNSNPLPNPWASTGSTGTEPVRPNPDPNAVNQMMQSLLSNPQHMNQILGLNPQLRNMLDSNSQLREMMQNPDFIRQMTSPEMMQQMLAFQQSLAAQFGRTQSNSGRAGGTSENMGLDMLMNMFGGLGVPSRPNVPPEELYAAQLAQLQEMGFFDTQENVRALTATSGNVNAAVDRLLGNPPNGQ